MPADIEKIHTENIQAQDRAKFALFQRGGAEEKGKTILAKEVARAPLEPEAQEWTNIDSVEIPLSAQVLVKPRLYEPSIDRLSVRALYDKENIVFLLEWQDKAEDKGVGRVASYRDAVAFQFPADPSKPIPHFAMGERNNPVTIYQWKADWEYALEHDVSEEYKGMFVDFYPHSGKEAGTIVKPSDYGKEAKPPFLSQKAFNTGWEAGNILSSPDLKARSPVEKLTATGFSTLTTDSQQDCFGKSSRKDGTWRVAISFPRKQGSFDFEQGKVVPVNFAVWDGSHGERGGEKSVSTWNWLALEKPTDNKVFFIPALAAAVIAALEWVILSRLRGRRNKV